MLANDVILRLVEMLMSEKDKNAELQLAHLQQQQANNKQPNED